MDVRILVVTLSVAVASFACAHVESDGPVQFVSRVKFQDAAGEVSFRIEADAGDVRVEDARGRLLVSLRAKAGGLTISDSRRRGLGLVAPLERRSGFRVAGEEGEALFELTVEPDGDMSLRTSDGRRLYHIKRRDYGFKILNAEGKLESKVRSRPRSTKTFVRNAAGETYLSTRDPIPAAAVATLVLDDVQFAHAAALCVAIVHWGIPGAAGEGPAPES